MSIILKQETANTVPTPPVGKGTLFLDENNAFVVKNDTGNVVTFPTAGGANTQVFYNEEGGLQGSPNFTWNNLSNTLTITNGNIVATGVKTDNLYYANGQAWDLQQPAGLSSQIQFNDANSFGATANFTWNNSTNTLTVLGDANVSGNISTSNITSTNINATLVGGTLTTSAQPNITSIGSLTNLNVAGNAVITGNLIVDGNISYVNVDTLNVEDPVISLGAGPNGAPLTSNDGKDRGTLLNYFTSLPVYAFMGWDNSNAEFSFGSNVGIVNDVVTFNTLGNVRAATVIANIDATTVGGTLTTAAQPNITSVGTLGSLSVTNKITAGQLQGDGGNISNVQGANVSGAVATATTAGTVTTNAQPNITSVGTLSSLDVTANVTAGGVKTDNLYYANGAAWDLSDPGGSNTAIQFNDDESFGGSAAFTFDKTSNLVTVTANLNANNLNAANFVTAGNVYANSGTVGASLLTGTLTTPAQPNITSVGSLTSLDVVGTANVGNINTGGVLSASGNVSGGNLTTTGAVVATGNVSGGNLTTGGALSVTGNANVGNIGATAGVFTGNVSAGNVSATDVTATTLGGTLTTAAQPNITSVGSLTDLSVSGNAVITGNLTVDGNISYVNVETLAVEDPVISLGNGPNGTPLTTNDGKDRGTLLSYYDTAPVDAFMGWDNSNAEFAFGSNVSVINDVVTYNALGNVRAGNFIGNGAALSAITGGNVTGTVASATTAGTVTTAAQPNITSVGTLTGLDVNGTIAATTVSATGITGTTLTGTLTTNAQPNITSVGTLGSLTVTNKITAGQLQGEGGNISNIQGANVSGTVSTAGTVTTAAQPNITSVGTLSSLSVTGNVSAGNVSATDISGTTLGGTLTTAAQPNITSVGTLSSLGVSGDISGANITANTKLVTDSITNKSGNLVVTSNENILLSTTGIIDAGSVRVANVGTPTSDQDAATKAYVDNLVSSGIHYHTPVRVESPTALNATYDNGTAGVGATLTNAGSNVALSIDGVSLSVADRVLVYTQANAVHNGVYVVSTVGDGSTAWVLTRADDADTYSPSSSDGLDEGSYFFVQEGATGAGESYVCNTVGTITFGTTEINFAQFSKAPIYTAGTGLTLSTEQFSISNTTVTSGSYGNGDSVATFTVNNQGQLTAASNTAITANAANLTGTTLAATIVNSSLTSVGTLGTLSVTGNASAGNLTTAGQVVATGNISGNYIIGNGAFLTGIDATAIQNGTANVRTFNNANVAISAAGNANVVVVTGIGANVAGDLTATGNVSGNIFSGNGSALSAIAGANITGTVANATYAVSSDTAGTVTSAAQPNITSVGTLTSLGVNGTVTAVAFTANTGVFTGNGSALSAIAGANVTGTVANATHALTADTANTATTAGTVTTAAQPNITSVGTLTSLSVTGNATAGNVYANSGTIGASLLTGTLTTAAQPNITSVGTLSSLSVTGNASAGNLSTDGQLSVSGNAIITGNLTVNGNVTYVNTETLAVEDPIINLQTGANGAAPIANSGKDVGTSLNYYDTAARVAFMGWDVSNAEFGLASVASITNEVVTFSTYGNLRVGNIIGNGQALTAINGSNVTGTVANATFATSAGSATTADTVTTAAQPNITSVGTLSSLAVTGNVTAGNLSAGAGGTLSGNLLSVATGNITTINSGLLQNGNSNISITANGNVSISATGTPAELVVTSTGVNVAGTLNATGNANVSNLGTAQVLATANVTAPQIISNVATGTAPFVVNSTTLVANLNVATATASQTAGTVVLAAQPNITSVGTLTFLSASGNIGTSAAITAGGNITGANLGTAGTVSAGIVSATGNISGANIVSSAYQVASVNGAVSAAGTTQATATVLTSQINVVLTVAAGAGVSLPNVPAGIRVTIMNTSANALLVYPASGEAINSLAANAAYSMPAGSRLDFVSTSATQWYTLNATYG